ncbi:preprotein translocase subunit Sec61beta [Methanosalsum natronophilum]|uniref:Preprotein translocase subunit SecG n=1 Tax=Methanosalsum natronophilum TaxID=768733 RepID=A0A424YYE8_9EURY|nr:preprotein translocase subunit Sec61beta [Methanosalsum natronophilum]RQD85802.1 MAG: preprotein translocase subunit Sec61beta [Methanosalsum natronophilum]
MAKKKSQGSGLMSSAGLMRYYDADKRSPHLNPKGVLIVGLLVGILVLYVNAMFGMWP